MDFEIDTRTARHRVSFEEIRHLCSAAHSRPGTATSVQVRLACLHRVPRHCTALFTCLHRASTSLACALLTPLIVFARLGAILSVSIRAVGDSLTGLLLGVALQPAREPLSSSRAESQAPFKVSGQKLPVKAPLSFPAWLCAS